MSYSLRITVFNNRDYEQPFTLNDENGDPYDLTGHKMSFGIGSDTKVIYSHTSDSAANKCIFFTDADTGQFKLVLPYSVLKTLTAGNYTHDLTLIDSVGKRIGVWSGQLTVKRGIS